MLVVSGSYQNYQNGAVSNRLTICGGVGGRVVSDNDSVHMLQDRDTLDTP